MKSYGAWRSRAVPVRIEESHEDEKHASAESNVAARVGFRGCGGRLAKKESVRGASHGLVVPEGVVLVDASLCLSLCLVFLCLSVSLSLSLADLLIPTTRPWQRKNQSQHRTLCRERGGSYEGCSHETFFSCSVSLKPYAASAPNISERTHTTMNHVRAGERGAKMGEMSGDEEAEKRRGDERGERNGGSHIKSQRARHFAQHCAQWGAQQGVAACLRRLRQFPASKSISAPDIDSTCVKAIRETLPSAYSPRTHWRIVASRA